MKEPEGEAPNVPQSTGGGQPRLGQSRHRRFVTVAGAIAAVAGLMLVLFYPIGFISFWWQLRRYYSFDAVTALYTASTVPSTVIGGSLVNVQQALGEGGSLAFGLFGITFGFYPVYRALGRKGKAAVIVGVSIAVIYEAADAVYFSCRFYIPSADAAFLWYSGAWVVAAAGGILGGYSAATSGLLWQNEQDEKNEQNAAAKDGASPWRRMAIATAFVLVAAVISSTILAALQYPDLPSVKIQSTSREYDEKRFALLSHSDQYWYVLNKEPKRDKKPESAVLYAIPDDKVEQARYIDTRGACPQSV